MAKTATSTATALQQVFRVSTRPTASVPSFLLPFRGQERYASKTKSKSKPKKKGSNMFDLIDPTQLPQFSLYDAMRYLKAAEVGRSPTSSKYELHLRLKTLKNGPVVRNRVRLPHPVKTDVRVAVVCPPESSAAQSALKAGAVMAGEDNIIELVQAGTINFDRLICHPDSLQKLNRAGLGRVLGPKGLMPSVKTNSVLKDVAGAVQQIAGASEYRERLGVVRMAVGQLGYTPEELQRNIKTFIEAVKKDMSVLTDRISKEIHEVVLSSTNGPGLSLNGELKSPESPPSKDLAVN